MRNVRRVVLFPAVLVAALVVLSAVVPATPVMDALTQRPATDATLVRPLAYVVLSPITATLDALTLLSLQQHAAVLLTLVVLVVAWRIVRARRHATSPGHEARVGATLFLVWIVVYVVGAIVLRPMAALRLSNGDDVAIDFHSHTSYSHDANKLFTTERNRAWHSAAGFDVAYLTDHKHVAAALEATARNPRPGRGTSDLLPGLEARDGSEHVLAIGIPWWRMEPAPGEWRDSTSDPAHPPVLVLTIPGKLDAIPQTELTGIARLVAIELSDGAPKGIGVLQRDRAQILAVARAHDLALVAGSDNHGWGSTAVGWTIMRIPGWRALLPTQLDSAIRRTLQTRRIDAARVYVRDSPDPGRSTAALALTLPAVIWRELVDLSWPERVSWLCWIVAAVSIASVATSRAAREKTPVAARRNPETA